MMLKIAQAMRNLHREEEGFTLIELLIVIAIIAVIAAIAIPTVANRIDDAREAADKANVKLLQGLVDLHYIDEGEFPVTTGFIGALVDKGYLLEAVKSPYPNVEEGYTLTVTGSSPREVAKVTSTQVGRWKDGATT